MRRYPAIITAAFLDKGGDPALGLSPGICIYQITSTPGSPQGDTLVIGTEGGSPIIPMTEIGKGFYKYVFAEYDSEIKYAYQIDGEAGGTGPKLGNGRFAVGTNQNFAEDIAHEVWEEPHGLHPLGGSPETVTDLLRQIFNATVGSPSGSGSSFTLNQIIAGVWGETLLGSPQPYPPGSAGNLLAYNNQLLLDILETSDDLGGSPRINLATTIWNTIITGSPQPFQPGSAGNTLTLTSETNITEQQVRTAVWEAPAADYGNGSPITMGFRNRTDSFLTRFGHAVTIDTLNGVAGTQFPSGTESNPVNNLDDALQIANSDGYRALNIIGDVIIDRGDWSDFNFYGQSILSSTITTVSNIGSPHSPSGSPVGSPSFAILDRCTFQDAIIQGQVGAQIQLLRCLVRDMSCVQGYLEDCLLEGTLRLVGSGRTSMFNCKDIDSSKGTPIVDLSNVPHELSIRDYHGGIEIRNKSTILPGSPMIQNNSTAIGLAAGRVILHESVTAGNIIIRGIGTIENNSSIIPDTRNLINNSGTRSFTSIG